MADDTKMNSGVPLDRAEVARILSKLLKKMDARTDGDRFRVRESDAGYLAYVRAMVQAATALNSVIKDDELSDLEDRISALEAKK